VTRIRVELPHLLRRLAGLEREIELEVAPPQTLEAVLVALEGAHPALQGTLRDPLTGGLRPLLILAAEGRDLGVDLKCPVPERVLARDEALLIIGSVMGG
jgi:sulfur-carrier protein